jgi:hypothetical protein
VDGTGSGGVSTKKFTTVVPKKTISIRTSPTISSMNSTSLNTIPVVSLQDNTSPFTTQQAHFTKNNSGYNNNRDKDSNNYSNNYNNNDNYRGGNSYNNNQNNNNHNHHNNNNYNNRPKRNFDNNNNNNNYHNHGNNRDIDGQFNKNRNSFSNNDSRGGYNRQQFQNNNNRSKFNNRTYNDNNDNNTLHYRSNNFSDDPDQHPQQQTHSFHDVGTTSTTAQVGGAHAQDEDGMPLRRTHGKSRYLQDGSLNSIEQLDNIAEASTTTTTTTTTTNTTTTPTTTPTTPTTTPTTTPNTQIEPKQKRAQLSGIQHWAEYKELSALVTSGSRSNVYHWLSDRSNRLKVDLNVTDPFGSTLLAQATRRHFYAVALTLMPFCDTNCPTLQGPPIFHALSLADLLITRAMLDFGADPNARNPQGQTPLMMAACVDNVSFVQYVLFKGANLNDTDDKGRTAIMYAAKKCSPQIARYLHSCGADLTITDHSGLTVFDYAERREDRDGLYLSKKLRETPPIMRILPNPEPIQKDLDAYRETLTFPRPLNFQRLKREFENAERQYGYDNLIIDPNGAFTINNGADVRQEMNTLFNDSTKNRINNNHNNTLSSFDNDSAGGIPADSFKHRDDRFRERDRQAVVGNKMTVFEDLLQRSDFSGRSIEHVDERYLEWYDSCRAIHIEDQTFKVKPVVANTIGDIKTDGGKQ